MHARKNNLPFTVVFMDINDFKTVNDTRGHVHGDHVLRECAAAIKASCRLVDMAFRYGGDEFFAILPDCSKSHTQEHFINRLTSLLQQRLPETSISYGIVEIGPQSNLTITDIVHLADAQMYQYKRQHKIRRAS